VASDLEDEEETSDEYGDDYEYQSPLNGETIITAEKAKTILDSLQIHPSSAGAQLNYDNAKVKFGV
jgi:hypothetical protein